MAHTPITTHAAPTASDGTAAANDAAVPTCSPSWVDAEEAEPHEVHDRRQRHHPGDLGEAVRQLRDRHEEPAEQQRDR